jgi:Glycine/serine hydroxymethyltransferase
MHDEFKVLANLIADVLDGFFDNVSNQSVEKNTKEVIKKICKNFPIY